MIKQENTEQDDSSDFDVNERLRNFWPRQRAKIRRISLNSLRSSNGHHKKEPQGLPLARIKKIMKIEEGVKSQMISAEAPVLLAKASEFIIEDLTLRSWIFTQENRRKTVQKSDVATAVSRCEMFDFLIDIVPRDEILKSRSNQMEQPEECYINSSGDVNSPSNQQPQYIFQCNGSDSVIQATQIGPSIPLSGNPGQPIQVMSMTNCGEQFQLMPVAASSQFKESL